MLHPDTATSRARPRVLVIACGAIAPELVEVVRLNGLDHVSITCLPAHLHNTPDRIPETVRDRIRRARGHYDDILVGYADCGTGGRLDQVCDEEGVERLAGSHCYEIFAGREAFAALHDEEPGTFYLTDFLARHFSRLVLGGLGLDRHPELHDSYFGNYRRLVYLAQNEDPALLAKACEAAERLGLELEVRRTGYAALSRAVVAFANRKHSVRRSAAVTVGAA